MARNTSGLKRGGSPGRPKGVANKVTQQLRAIAEQLTTRPSYVKKLQERMDKGKIAPAVECMLWYYAAGKPKETVEFEGDGPLPELRVTIVDHAKKRLPA